METITFFKDFFGSVVRLHMIDDQIVKLVWEVMVLKRRFEDDPYSLSAKQIKILKDHEAQTYKWHFSKYKDLLAKDAFSYNTLHYCR